jgi:glutathione S-transferase
VLMAEKGIAHEFVEESVWADTTSVGRFNPLTKVPVLVLVDGTCLYDSSVITEYIDGLAPPNLIPAAGRPRAIARRNESLGDGLCDAAVAIVLERKREAARQDPAVLKRQLAKVDAAIATYAELLSRSEWLGGAAPALDDLAAGCALFYVEFRLPEVNWRERHDSLRRWAEKLEGRPSFASTRPS